MNLFHTYHTYVFKFYKFFSSEKSMERHTVSDLKIILCAASAQSFSEQSQFLLSEIRTKSKSANVNSERSRSQLMLILNEVEVS